MTKECTIHFDYATSAFVYGWKPELFFSNFATDSRGRKKCVMATSPRADRLKTNGSKGLLEVEEVA